MNMEHRAVASGLILWLLVGSVGCRQQMQPSTGRKLPVGIQMEEGGKGCYPDYNSVTLNKKKHDEVRWSSLDNHAYTVYFTPSTPFRQGQNPQYTFDVPAVGHVDSGPPTQDATGNYAYGIKLQDGTICKDPKSDDPGVHIKP
jgi:hypothetical protein